MKTGKIEFENESDKFIERKPVMVNAKFKVGGQIEQPPIQDCLSCSYLGAKKYKLCDKCFEIDQLKSRVREFEEREAACCPEDFGFDEYIGILESRVEHLEGILSGDPNLTATKEEREAWRLSAVRYADKCESEVKVKLLRELIETIQTGEWDDRPDKSYSDGRQAEKTRVIVYLQQKLSKVWPIKNNE